MSHISKKAVAALAVAAATGAGTTVLLSGSADALPASQRSCSFSTQSVTTADGWKPLGMSATINNGTQSRIAVAQLAADIGVDTLAEVRVGYSVDGGPVQERVYGPANLANHDEYWETRSTLAVIPLGAGTHTVTPYWRISGAVGKNGYFQTGCFTVEARTR